MNRENKRKTFEKGYFRNHACKDIFTCKVCGRQVVPEGGGIMEPVAVWIKKNGEWSVIHRCKRCGKFSANRTAADDNPMKLMSIAMKPLANPPFPVEFLEELTEQMGGDGSIQ